MSKEKGKEVPDYTSHMLEHDSEEEGRQSITSNIRQLMTGISPREFQHQPAHADSSRPLVVHTTMTDDEEGTNRLGMEVDAELIRTKKQGRNEN